MNLVHSLLFLIFLNTTANANCPEDAFSHAIEWKNGTAVLPEGHWFPEGYGNELFNKLPESETRSEVHPVGGRDFSLDILTVTRASNPKTKKKGDVRHFGLPIDQFPDSQEIGFFFRNGSPDQGPIVHFERQIFEMIKRSIPDHEAQAIQHPETSIIYSSFGPPEGQYKIHRDPGAFIILYRFKLKQNSNQITSTFVDDSGATDLSDVSLKPTPLDRPIVMSGRDRHRYYMNHHNTRVDDGTFHQVNSSEQNAKEPMLTILTTILYKPGVNDRAIAQ